MLNTKSKSSSRTRSASRTKSASKSRSASRSASKSRSYSRSASKSRSMSASKNNSRSTSNKNNAIVNNLIIHYTNFFKTIERNKYKKTIQTIMNGILTTEDIQKMYSENNHSSVLKNVHGGVASGAAIVNTPLSAIIQDIKLSPIGTGWNPAYGDGDQGYFHLARLMPYLYNGDITKHHLPQWDPSVITQPKKCTDSLKDACIPVDASCSWPPNTGCASMPKIRFLEANSVFDRICLATYKLEDGTYVSPIITPGQRFTYSARAMKTYSPMCMDQYNINEPKINYKVFRTNENLPIVTCNAISAFGFPGGATQYQFCANQHIMAIWEASQLYALGSPERILWNSVFFTFIKNQLLDLLSDPLKGRILYYALAPLKLLDFITEISNNAIYPRPVWA